MIKNNQERKVTLLRIIQFEQTLADMEAHNNTTWFWFGPFEQGNNTSPDNCLVCQHKLAAIKTINH